MEYHRAAAATSRALAGPQSVLLLVAPNSQVVPGEAWEGGGIFGVV